MIFNTGQIEFFPVIFILALCRQSPSTLIMSELIYST